MKTEENEITNLTKLYVISMLKKEKMHGYELMDSLEKLTGKRPSAGQIYPLLAKLKKNGYISCDIFSNGKKKMKVYRITKSGKDFADSLLNRFSSLVESAIESKIHICPHCKCEVYKGGYKYKNKMFCCKSCTRITSK